MAVLLSMAGDHVIHVAGLKQNLGVDLRSSPSGSLTLSFVAIQRPEGRSVLGTDSDTDPDPEPRS
jgi:hypothetical protein